MSLPRVFHCYVPTQSFYFSLRRKMLTSSLNGLIDPFLIVFFFFLFLISAPRPAGKRSGLATYLVLNWIPTWRWRRGSVMILNLPSVRNANYLPAQVSHIYIKTWRSLLSKVIITLYLSKDSLWIVVLECKQPLRYLQGFAMFTVTRHWASQSVAYSMAHFFSEAVLGCFLLGANFLIPHELLFRFVILSPTQLVTDTSMSHPKIWVSEAPDIPSPILLGRRAASWLNPLRASASTSS